jgi:DnaJ domain
MASVANHYAILGVSETATAAAIKRAYRSKIKATHPDLAANESDRKRRTEAAAAINSAKTVLLDPDKRAAYDLDLFAARRTHSDPSAYRQSAPPRSTPPRRTPYEPPPDHAQPLHRRPAPYVEPTPHFNPTPYVDPVRGSFADLGLRRRTKGNLDALIAFVRWNSLGQLFTLAVVILAATWLVPFFNISRSSVLDPLYDWHPTSQIVLVIAFVWLCIGAAWSRSWTEHPLGHVVRLGRFLFTTLRAIHEGSD